MADVAKKLLVKPGDRLLLLDPPADALAILGVLPDTSLIVGSGPADVAVVFAFDEVAFRRAIPALQERARSARAAWVAYPKLSSTSAGTLNRDLIRATLEDTTDITPVTQVALDATWSALRIRPKDQVGR